MAIFSSKGARNLQKNEDIFSRIFCSVRFKTCFFLIIVFLLLLVSVAVLVLLLFPLTNESSTIFNLNLDSKSFNRIIGNLIAEQARSLVQFIAGYDGTYNPFTGYAIGDDQGYPVHQYAVDNWPANVFTNQQIDFIGYYFTNGSLYYTVTYNRNTGVVTYDFKSPDYPSELIKFPNFGYNFNIISSRGATFISPASRNETYLIVAVPITKTDLTGTPPGYMILGKQITYDYIYDLAQRSKICITPYFTNNSTQMKFLSEDYSTSQYNKINIDILTSNWTEQDVGTSKKLYKVSTPTSYIKNTFHYRACYYSDQAVQNRTIYTYNDQNTLSTDSIFGYNTYYSKIDNKPAVIFRVDETLTTQLSNLAYASIGIVLGVLIFVGCLTFFIIILCLELCFVFRVTGLTNQIKKIQKSENIDDRLKEKGLLNFLGNKDEIEYLTKAINQLLRQIDSKTKDLQDFVIKLGKEEERVRAIMRAMLDAVVLVNEQQQITFRNPAFEKLFNYKGIFCVKKKGVDKILITDIIPDFEKIDKNSIKTQAKTSNGVTLDVQITITITEFTKEKVEENDVEDMDESDPEDDADKVITKNEKMKIIVIRDLNLTGGNLVTKKKNEEFEKDMSHSKFRQKFKEFCEKEYTHENIYLLEDIIDYKNMDNIKRKEKQKEIYSKYIKEGAELPINLSKEDMDSVKKDINDGLGQIDLFNGLEDIIKGMVINESYNRFKASLEESEEKNE
jgi:PAS domain-containing protein